MAIATSAALFVAGCGSDDGKDAASTPTTEPAPTSSTVTPAPTTYPLTIDNCGREVTFEAPPERVLILNGASVAEAESLIALGLEDHVLANSQTYGISEDPEMVDAVAALPTGDLTLNDSYEVPREQVLALEPDLVISTYAGGFDDAIGSISRDQLADAGIESYVTPSNCANGAAAPRPEDQERLENQSIESSYELLAELGVIFDAQEKAAEVIEASRARVAEVSERVEGSDPVNVLVAYPGMSMMNANGLPAVFGGGIFDDIIERAGGRNVFGGLTYAELNEINAEALASADVDVLVIGLYQPGEDADLLAKDLFEKFPEWDAAKDDRYTSVSDSFYLGPLNDLAIERIAAVAHPE